MVVRYVPFALALTAVATASPTVPAWDDPRPAVVRDGPWVSGGCAPAPAAGWPGPWWDSTGRSR
ncbi:hypothetical protein [Paractinoplanes maris]|uniref:hypothetical protein n=1 Tax=Paractinoplanes maris TaxID=1734446 RepID=UPI00201FBB49|nr:hypothetical protein [Actinoplanes maris]